MNDTGVQALQLIGNLLDDFQDPNFIWQLLALLTSLLLAWLIARRWQAGRTQESNGRLRQVGSRLAFPLSGMLLTGVALLLLKPFFSVSLLKLALPLLGSMALVRSVIFVLRQAFPGARWLTAWEKIIATLVWGWLALYITDLAPYVIDALEQFDFTLGKQKLNLWLVISGVTTVFLTLVFALWIAGVIETRLMGLQTLDGNLRIVGIRVTKAALTVVAIISSLAMVGIDMTALSVFTGALGVGLGFGLQKIASNYVSGFIILLERSIRIGNIVQVGADAGEVTQITTRYTVLKHPGGTEFIVPNETLIGSTVQNQTYSDHKLRLATVVGVAYDTDLDLAMRLLVECAKRQPRVLAAPEPKVLLTLFGDSSINLELGFWVDDPENGKMNVVSDINLAIWHAFKENGIQIPFPQREVRILNPASE
ncbi:mechanosensitive ion channel protein MscS [Azonexus hydrophilus]|uniref:Mechanosensitive ion channel protein MscS n=1 Tax=Azonexus hydrophilus TaxID=418702 RepID=A0A1R1HZC5_9RHOO|nr:mechanosensitive ion channel domain-containing protein [Azonexus hydrophilus]OMG51813.1 mechanosensitive ion channel protein MscS [Azonexus hydrophilus]